MKNITKDQFAAILREAGVTEAQMKKLHSVFEARHPAQHQAFLEQLGVSADEIREIRSWAAK